MRDRVKPKRSVWDRMSRMSMKTYVVTFLGLNLVDYGLTTLGLSYGATEANPLMELVQGVGGPWFFAVKMGTALAIAGLLVSSRDKLPQGGKRVAVVIAAAMAVVVVWNAVSIATWRFA